MKDVPGRNVLEDNLLLACMVHVYMTNLQHGTIAAENKKTTK